MRGWSSVAARSTVAAVAVSGTILAGFSPATAQSAADDVTDDWGTILPNAGCSQATAWLNRLKGVGGVVNMALFEVHSPPTDKTPEVSNLGSELVKMTDKGTGLGVASGYAARTYAGKLPAGPGAPPVAAECAAYAEVTLGTIDVGVPYIASLLPGGTQMSPVGVHLESPTIEAKTQPGEPVKLSGGAAAGYISSVGLKALELPKTWPVNFGLRIPSDYNLPAIASVMTNEQVTTDEHGRPTKDSSGRYQYDKTASSGYVNGIHITLLGNSVGDFTWGHVGVLRPRDSNEMPPCAAPNARCARTTS